MTDNKQFDNVSKRSALKTGALGFASITGLAGVTTPVVADNARPPGGGSSEPEKYQKAKLFQDTLGEADSRYDNMPEYETLAVGAVTAEHTPDEPYDYDVNASMVGTHIVRENNYEPYDEILWDDEPIHAAVGEFGLTVEMRDGSLSSPPARRDFETESGGVGVGIGKHKQDMSNQYNIDDNNSTDYVYDQLSDESEEDTTYEQVGLILDAAAFAASLYTRFTLPGKVLSGVALAGSIIASSIEESEPNTVSNDKAEYIYESPYGVDDNEEHWVYHTTVTQIGVNGDKFQIEPYVSSVQHGDEWSFKETVDLTQFK